MSPADQLHQITLDLLAINLGVILLITGFVLTVFSIRRVVNGNLNAVTIPTRAAIIMVIGLVLITVGMIVQ